MQFFEASEGVSIEESMSNPEKCLKIAVNKAIMAMDAK